MGLVDEIGFIEDAIQRAVELANLEAENVRVVRYTAPITLTNALGLGRSANGSSPNQLA